MNNRRILICDSGALIGSEVAKKLLEVQDGDVVLVGNDLEQKENDVTWKIEYPKKYELSQAVHLDYDDTPKPKHHNSKFGPSVKKRKKIRNQQKRSRKNNR